MKKIIFITFFICLNVVAQSNSKDLTKAIWKNNVDEFKKILNENPQLVKGYKNDDRNIVLEILNEGDFSEILTYAIQKGADPHATSDSKTNSLHDAVWNKYHKCLKILIAAKVNLEQKGENDQTPLLYAIIKGDIVSVKLLVEAGADIKSLVGDRKINVFRHAIRGKEDDIAMYFLDKKVDINSDKDAENVEPLVNEAAFYGCPKVLDYLLTNGASANTLDSVKDSVLFAAVSGNNLECVKVLLKHGAKIDKKSLRRAKLNNKNEILKILNNK